MDYVTPVTDDEKNHHFYPTPKALAVAALSKCLPFNFQPSLIVDLGAGTGVWGEAAFEQWIRATIHGVELRDVQIHPAYSKLVIGDMRDKALMDAELQVGEYELCAGNLPFKYAEEGVKVAHRLLRDGGHCLQLLPAAFLGTQNRGAWLWESCPPYKVYMVLKRPSFKDGRDRKTGKVRKGSTDPGKEYIIGDWIKGYNGPTYITKLDW